MKDKQEHDALAKAAAKDTLAQLLEVLDNKLPIVGNIMDLPMIDALERQLVDAVVDAAWEPLGDGDGGCLEQEDPMGFVCA